MLVSPSTVQRDSPRDRRRYAIRYSTGLTPSTLALIFQSADEGMISALMELLQELTKDELIGSFLDLRLGSLSQRDVEVKPCLYDDPVRAAEVVDFSKALFAALRFWSPAGDGYCDEGGIPEVIEAIDSSFYFGLALPWVHWAVPTGEKLPLPVAVELLDQRRYRTWPPTNEVLLEDANHYWGVPISQYDPWLLQPAYGRSLSPRKEFAGVGRSVAFAWHLRSQARLHLLGYAERFAIPAVVGTFNGSIDEIKGSYDEAALAKLQLFVESFMSDAAGLFPPNFAVNIVSAKPGGEGLFNYIDVSTRSAIAVALAGQDGTSSGEGGSLAKAQVNELSRQDLIRKGGRRVASWLKRFLSYPVELVFGEGTPAPEIGFALTPHEEDAAARDRLQLAQTLGLPVEVTYALSALGLPEPADGATLIDGSTWDAATKRRIPAPGAAPEAPPPPAPRPTETP